MRQSKVLSFALCLALTVCAVHARDLPNTNHSNDGAAVRNGFPNVFRPVGRVFKRLFGTKRTVTDEYGYANVTKLTLSRNEIIVDRSANANIRVSDMRIGVYGEGSDPENDLLVFSYTVSGGVIIGEGDKVIWDLSGVKSGTYTITAGVDDGCGVCGQTVTKTVTVTECADCL